MTAEGPSAPAWLVLNKMADAVVDARWSTPWTPEDGGSLESWLQAKEGDFVATRDDMAEAAIALEAMGLLVLDWEAEGPSPKASE